VSPNPGSDEALAAGCRCPVLDNAHGRGAYREPDGTPQFWINSDCPLHGAASPVEPPPAPGWCVVHGHYKWCEHNGGVMGPTGYEAPADGRKGAT